MRLLIVESRDSGWKGIHHLDLLVRYAAVTEHHRLNHYFPSSRRIGSQYQGVENGFGSSNSVFTWQR